jgi:hypothetical protein
VGALVDGNVPSPGNTSHFGFEITEEYLELCQDVWKFMGRDVLPQFDRDWKAKLFKKAAQRGKMKEYEWQRIDAAS